MSKYTDEGRYNVGVQYPNTKPGLTPIQVVAVQDVLSAVPVRQVTYPALAANQNDFPLSPTGDWHCFTSAGNTITGFAGQQPGLFTVTNVDPSTSLTIADGSVGSVAENRILCHTGANIVLGPRESVFMRYDPGSQRWRTLGFT